MEISDLAKVLIFTGLAIALIGLILFFGHKIPLIGKLPGDFSWKGKNWSVYFPLATSIILSIILSLILYLINKFR